MVNIPEDIKKDLKKPLGRIGKPEELRALASQYKIIAVGDISTLECLKNGLRPHIAVFDMVYMRKVLDEKSKKILEQKFPNPMLVTNPPGSITEAFIAATMNILEHGGAIRVQGEEDLTALVMIALADSKTTVIYGQPDEGLVFVEPNDKTKNKAREILKKLGLLD